jgi:hypothetical protein
MSAQPHARPQRSSSSISRRGAAQLRTMLSAVAAPVMAVIDDFPQVSHVLLVLFDSFHILLFRLFLSLKQNLVEIAHARIAAQAYVQLLYASSSP